MYQCLVCEDWLHHACLFGSHSDSNASPLHSDDFDLLICERCVKGNARVRRLFDRWAGCEGSGIMIIAKDDTVLGTVMLEDDEDNEEEQVGTGAVVGEKRKTEDDDAVASTSASTSVSQEPATKRFKEEDGSSSSIGSSLASLDSTSTTTSRTTLASSQSDDKGCSAPPLPVDGVSPLARVMAEGGRGNMYLGDGWMERWCHCDRCLPLFDHMPYLLEEEELYEPPQDTEREFLSPSLLPATELGLAGVQRSRRWSWGWKL
jgi:E3 ubiquitin-protein ligase UBR7